MTSGLRHNNPSTMSNTNEYMAEDFNILSYFDAYSVCLEKLLETILHTSFSRL